MLRAIVFILPVIILMPMTLLAGQEIINTKPWAYTQYAVEFDISKREHEPDKAKKYAKKYLTQLKEYFKHTDTIKPTHYQMGAIDILGFPHWVDIYISLDDSVTYDQLQDELKKQQFDTKVTLKRIITTTHTQTIHP